MKEFKINLYEGCEYHAILKIENLKGELRYYWRDKEFTDEFNSNFHPDVFSITIRIAEFICASNFATLVKY